MPRALFEKTGNARYISHLDLMRVFQRAFKRAGLPLTHTQGFNPRASVSIALPLSLGVESRCELLDFDLEHPVGEIREKLNAALIDGVYIREVYEQGQKLKNLSDQEVEIVALHSCQNPSLNPMQLSAAITKYLPELTPDYVRCFREEIYDTNEMIFR